jgi:hypothetical protein
LKPCTVSLFSGEPATESGIATCSIVPKVHSAAKDYWFNLRFMRAHLSSPMTFFAIALIVQGIAVYVGDFLRKRAQQLRQDERHDFDTVRTATMTLLALIIGFTFSMAVSRYDQRKALEEAEANAVGTEYLRVDLLPDDLGVQAKALLRNYLDQRIEYYENDDERVDRGTAVSQGELWTAVVSAAAKQPTPVVALAISGMNDVLNSQGYTQAAWRNRIPIGGWAMMGVMAICCNILVGYGERRRGGAIVFILPIVVSIAFFLIADLDSPRGGTIRVHPENLHALERSLKAP